MELDSAPHLPEHAIRGYVRHLIRTLGPRHAAKVLGLSLAHTLALGADAPAPPKALAEAGERMTQSSDWTAVLRPALDARDFETRLTRVERVLGVLIHL